MAAVEKAATGIISGLIPDTAKLNKYVLETARKVATNKTLNRGVGDIMSQATEFVTNSRPVSGIHPVINKNLNAAAETIASINADNFDDSLNILSKQLKKGKVDSDGVDSLISYLGEEYAGAKVAAAQRISGKTAYDLYAELPMIDGKERYSIMGTLKYAAQYPRGYLNNYGEGGPESTKRMLGAIGATEGLVLASRFSKGGSLTEDQYGERNIAGVPFI